MAGGGKLIHAACHSVIGMIGIFLIVVGFSILSAYGTVLQNGIHLRPGHHCASSLTVVKCGLRLRLAAVNFSMLLSILGAYVHLTWPGIGNFRIM